MAKMKFIAQLNNKKIKTFPVVASMADGGIYRKFNAYCHDKGFTERVLGETSSFGYVSWRKPGTDDCISLVLVD